MQTRVTEVVLVIYHLSKVWLLRNIKVLFRKQLHLLLPILRLYNISVNMQKLCNSVLNGLIAALKSLEVKERYIIHLLVSLVHSFKKVSKTFAR